MDFFWNDIKYISFFYIFILNFLNAINYNLFILFDF